jgi:hypothetical protein
MYSLSMALLQKGKYAKASGCLKQTTESVITLLPNKPCTFRMQRHGCDLCYVPLFCDNTNM